MSEEEFTKLDLNSKWLHVSSIMDYITSMDAQYNQAAETFKLRRQLNPHHSQAYVKEEEKQLKHKQRSMRIDQYQRWAHVKALYATHRDEMVDTLSNERFAECKSILEKVFTMELDDALRDVIED